jgi:ribonuclease R
MSQDPHFDREKAKYENPVASREHLLQVLVDAKQALSFMEICVLVDAREDLQQVGIQRRLRAMEREGQIRFTAKKKYEPQAQDEILTGRVIGHRDGFGFLHISREEKDWYLSAGQMKNVVHGDIVQAVNKGVDRKGRNEARITKVVTPRPDPIVGRIFVEHGVAVVIPDDSRIQHEIFIGPQDTKGARQGNVVVVEFVKRPSKISSPAGKVIEVLGEHLAPGMEIEMALRTFDIPHVWPKAVEKQVAPLGEQVPEDAKQGRVDLRDIPLVTIDGEDARDFDDAVYCQTLTKDGLISGYKLYVAIADVSYYVRPGSALDQEAINRGNSVYFPAQVIPMLPEVLSNGLCSLNPEVDRLCMVCEMNIDLDGQCNSYQFYEAVMRSQARFTYTKVAAILENDAELRERYEPFVDDLENLHALYKVLKTARDGRGAVEFETNESKFVFNAQRKIENIVALHRNDAHKLIEECMILANVCTAKFLAKNKAEGLYRVHDKPDPDRLLSFTSYLAEVGVTHKLASDTSASAFTHVMQKVRNRADSELIQTMLLRSMKQAVYDNENIGHFGLALEEYAHFTSPIRRYPDLVVHRAIKGVLAKQKSVKSKSGGKLYSSEEVETLGEQCSMTERRADDATRDVADWLKCEFMQDHVGDVFQAVVASVTNFGLFVRITDFGIDGLVHVTALGNDYYRFDDVKQMLIGEASGRVFRLGDGLEVKVAGVNLDDRKIDLVLANSEPDMPKSKRKKTTKTRKGPSKPGTDAPKARPPRAKKGKSSSRDKKKKKQSKHRK